MTDRVSHRGPDGSGIEIVARNQNGPLVVFGHRRLAIIDLSPSGHQPMPDATSGNWITFNGEIYNYRELRAELAGRGHGFNSQSDTEVILRAYAEWGVGCWRRLRGIFAFGLWDARYRELHLVRDHLGVKPVYYAAGPHGLAFASEVRAILASQFVDRRISGDGLRSFLKYGSVQEPCTMVDGVLSLAAGHYLTCKENGSTTLRHYWSLQECMFRNWTRPPAAEEVRAQLEASVRSQLVADVPVGVFLSAGVDSTAVAALAARAQPGAIHTFCIGTEDPDSDESAEAAQSAALLGCHHTNLPLEGRVVREKLHEALACYDQPSADGINTYFISMLVRQAGMKVALSGLGGDEVFVGYSGFRKGLAVDRIGRTLNWLPREIRQVVGRLASAASPPGNASLGALGELLEPGLAAPYFASRVTFNRTHIDELLNSRYSKGHSLTAWELRERNLARTAEHFTAVDRVSFLEMETYMLSTLLRDSDQMSMAHGLELRVPLIDPLVVEHVLPIGLQEKAPDGATKRLLTDALADILPPGVAQRRKRGFVLPFQDWLATDLKDEVGACFNSDQPRGPWNRQVFRKVWADFRCGRVAWSRVLTLFVLERWLERNRVAV